MFAGWECKTLPIIKICVVDLGRVENSGKLVFVSGGWMTEGVSFLLNSSFVRFSFKWK